MELRIKLTEQEIYTFLKHTFYRGARGAASLICVLLMILVVAVSWNQQPPAGRVILSVGVVLLILMQPFALHRRAAAQVKDPEQSKEMFLHLDYNGIKAQQGRDKANIGWRQVEKVTRLTGLYVVGLRGNKAYLIPDRALTWTKKEQFEKLLKTYVSAEKLKGI